MFEHFSRRCRVWDVSTVYGVAFAEAESVGCIEVACWEDESSKRDFGVEEVVAQKSKGLQFR